MGNLPVPDPFGYQQPPASPGMTRVDGLTQVSIRSTFRDFIQQHLPDATEEHQEQMQRMFVALLPR